MQIGQLRTVGGVLACLCWRQGGKQFVSMYTLQRRPLTAGMQQKNAENTEKFAEKSVDVC